MSNSKRHFLKYLFGAFAGVGATLAAIPFIRFLSPKDYKSEEYSKDIDISKLKSGQVMSIVWRNKPIYILKRDQDVINSLQIDNPKLRDTGSNQSIQPENAKNTTRSIKPEILVVENICTHKGCSVAYDPPGNKRFPSDHELSKFGGFYCACHGAIYDAAGRVFKNNPAPHNLVVPKHEFVNEHTIRFRDHRLDL